MAQKPRTCLQILALLPPCFTLRVSISWQVMGGPCLGGPGGQGLTAQQSLTSSAYAQDRGSSIRSPSAWDEGSSPAVTQMWDATQALMTCPASWEGGRENHTTSRKA